MVMFLDRPVYIFVAVVRVTVGAVHRSRDIRQDGPLVFGGLIFRQSVCLSVGVPLVFAGTCLYLTVVFLFN